MAELDKQYIRDLIAKGNRFEAMNIFIQSKFGKPDNSENVQVKREFGNEPVVRDKKSKEVNQGCEGKDNSESESEGSDGGSDSESSGSSHGSLTVPRSEALVPEVELKEDENLDVDIETVDPLAEVLPRPHTLEQAGPAQLTHQHHNMQGEILRISFCRFFLFPNKIVQER